MNLQNQISLINNSQDFTRLCNAVLTADYGDDFLPIDDDRADAGNDGYVKSEKQIFAAHCFKRIQNQSIENEIRKKMTSDLRKAILLKDSKEWEIENWTFISNYPVNESIGRKIYNIGLEAGINVSWKGPDYLASVLQKAKDIRSQFPNLEANEVVERLEGIRIQIEAMNIKTDDSLPALTRTPRKDTELEQLINEKPPGWEYLLFAGTMYIEKLKIESKWHDFEMKYGRRTGLHFSDREAVTYLSNKWSDLAPAIDGASKALADDVRLKAFGPEGQPGDVDRIIHMAKHVVGAYEQMLDWAADLRGAGVSELLGNLYEAAAEASRQPISEFRDFVDSTVKQFDVIPSYFENDDPNKEPLRIESELHLTTDPLALGYFKKLMKKTRKKIR